MSTFYEENIIVLNILLILGILIVLSILVSEYRKRSAIHIWTVIFKYGYSVYYNGLLLDKYRLNYNNFKKYDWVYEVKEEGIINISCIILNNEEDIINMLPIVDKEEKQNVGSIRKC